MYKFQQKPSLVSEIWTLKTISSKVKLPVQEIDYLITVNIAKVSLKYIFIYGTLILTILHYITLCRPLLAAVDRKVNETIALINLWTGTLHCSIYLALNI